MQKSWWQEAAVYQIYPRSFQDSNNDGIGDLQGIISRLDYIKNLGVDVIWLCPVYQSPNYDNGYDISDYQDIMADFGTMADFEELLKQAHQKGLKIIMDLVVNHTSFKHRWFVESRKSKDNEYRDYYIWREGKNDQPPNLQQSVFEGSAWQYDEDTEMYYLHLYTKEQPDLNWENEKVRNEVYKMMEWWLDKGIDGFRMDVINQISKDFEKMDKAIINDPHMYEIISNGPRVHEFLQEMHDRVLAKYDTMTVGETADVSVEDALLYAGFDRRELKMIFQFEHMSLDKGPNLTYQRPKLADLKVVFERWQTGLNGKAWNALYWDNHDRPRAVSKYGDDSTPFYLEKSAKMLALFMFWMQGTPYIYQGEEIGMTNDYLEKIEDYEDIESLTSYYQRTEGMGEDPEYMFKCVQKKSRDNARTAMQWDDSEYAGFGDAGCWFTINPNYKTINVKNQINDAESIYSYYKKLIQLRKNYPIIVYGDFHPLYEESEKNYCYIRELGKEKLLVLCSFSEEEQLVELPDEFFGRKGITLISNYDKLIDLNNCIEDEKTVLLKAYEARVIYYN